MGNPGPRHQAAVRLANTHPLLAEQLAEQSGAYVPPYDLRSAGPTTHELKTGVVNENDATVYLTSAGKPVHFYQLEVQQEYYLEKYATLHAYHGSEVSKSRCGGQVIVLSPSPRSTAKFRKIDADLRDEFAFHAIFLSREDLVPFADPDRTYPERALAAVMTDYKTDIPDWTIVVLDEMARHDKRLAELMLDVIMSERPPGDKKLEAKLSPATIEKLLTIPSFKARYDRRHAEGHAEGLAEGHAEQVAADLLEYFRIRQDSVSPQALATIQGCTDAEIAAGWLHRAYRGQNAAEIFDSATD